MKEKSDIIKKIILWKYKRRKINGNKMKLNLKKFLIQQLNSIIIEWKEIESNKNEK